MNDTPAIRRALITGGTSGIGAGVAKHFARAGWRVIATGVSNEEVAAFVSGCDSKELRENIEAHTLDVTNASATAALVERIPRLDALVNCAGIILRGGAEFDPESFARVLDVNLTGTMRLCTACRPLLAESQGCIVNLASMLSIFGSRFAPAYSASKGGVMQLTKSLAMAWAADGIRVNSVAPGWIESPLTKPLMDDTARRQAIIDRTPMARWGTPEDVAPVVEFLCSSAARFITGVMLPVDGGYSVS